MVVFLFLSMANQRIHAVLFKEALVRRNIPFDEIIVSNDASCTIKTRRIQGLKKLLRRWEFYWSRWSGWRVFNLGRIKLWSCPANLSPIDPPFALHWQLLCSNNNFAVKTFHIFICAPPSPSPSLVFKKCLIMSFLLPARCVKPRRKRWNPWLSLMSKGLSRDVNRGWTHHCWLKKIVWLAPYVNVPSTCRQFYGLVSCIHAFDNVLRRSPDFTSFRRCSLDQPFTQN